MKKPLYTWEEITSLVNTLKKNEVQGYEYLLIKSPNNYNPEMYEMYLKLFYGWTLLKKRPHHNLTAHHVAQLLYSKTLEEIPLLINDKNYIITLIIQWRLKVGR